MNYKQDYLFTISHLNWHKIDLPVIYSASTDNAKMSMNTAIACTGAFINEKSDILKLWYKYLNKGTSTSGIWLHDNLNKLAVPSLKAVGQIYNSAVQIIVVSL